MNKVIYVEMGQRLLPTCKSESASHSVGCAITKMALDSVSDKVAHMRHCLTRCVADLVDKEADHTPDKLDEHIDILHAMRGVLHETLDQRIQTLEVLEVDEAEVKNSVNAILRLVPGIEQILNQLQKLLNELDKHLAHEFDGLEDILEYMKGVSESIKGKINAGEHPETRKRIKKLMKGRLPNMLNMLTSIERQLVSVENKLGKDWRADIKQLFAKKWGCVPITTTDMQA
ncbi:MAG: hypothetical protein ACYTEO_14545 [Planctomycetota bacterium]